MTAILKGLARLMNISRTSKKALHCDQKHGADWFETYLLAHSDPDARWYYERRISYGMDQT